jgi:cell division protein FtsI (penicillin-binding protein 3)
MARDQASQRPMLARVPAHRAPAPLVRAGVQDEIALVCQRIGLPASTQATGGEEWVRATRAVDTASVTRAVSVMPNKSVTRANRMPDAHGLTLRDALFMLENRGLRVQASGTGRVREQSLAPDERVKRGTVVRLALQPTATTAAAPLPLPEPEHTEIAENTLLVPAEMDGRTARPAKISKPTTSAKSTTGKGKEKSVSSKEAGRNSTDKNKSKDKPAKNATPKTGSDKTTPKPRRTPPADIRTTQRGDARPAADKPRRVS